MFSSADYMNFTPCMHRRITTEFTGGMHFSEGEIFEDIQERLVCLECGEYVTEAELRAYWGKVPSPQQEASDGND